jgi:hypothetical protein
MKSVKKILRHLGYDIIAVPRHQKTHDPSWDKVFGIGANKTGTSSLEVALRNLGVTMPEQGLQEHILTRRVLDGDVSALREFCASFDAFQDLPFSHGLTFAACDAIFPNARFILTVRDSCEWFESVVRFQSKVFGLDPKIGSDAIKAHFENSVTYIDADYARQMTERSILDVSDHAARPDWSKVFDKASYVARYEERNAAIIRHFWGRPNKLLVLDVRQEKTTEKLVRFLGLPHSEVGSMPHKNAS